jgi:hypothetical protein
MKYIDEEKDRAKSYFNNHKFVLTSSVCEPAFNMPETVYRYGDPRRIEVVDKVTGKLIKGLTIILTPHITHVENTNRREEKEDYEADVHVIMGNGMGFYYQTPKFTEFAKWLLSNSSFECKEERDCLYNEAYHIPIKDMWWEKSEVKTEADRAYEHWNMYMIQDDEYFDGEYGIYEAYNMYDAFYNYCGVMRRYGETDRDRRHIIAIEEIPYTVEKEIMQYSAYRVRKNGEFVPKNERTLREMDKYGLLSNIRWKDNNGMYEDISNQKERNNNRFKNDVSMSDYVYVKRNNKLIKVRLNSVNTDNTITVTYNNTPKDLYFDEVDVFTLNEKDNPERYRDIETII